MYFFRDSVGNEVDLIIERAGKTTVIEIKSSQKFDSNMLKGLKFWEKFQAGKNRILIYGGERLTCK
jgi:hypothetical protein